jgi:hypothetical protein
MNQIEPTLDQVVVTGIPVTNTNLGVTISVFTEIGVFPSLLHSTAEVEEPFMIFARSPFVLRLRVALLILQTVAGTNYASTAPFANIYTFSIHSPIPFVFIII